MIEIKALASSSAGNCYRVTDGRTPLLIEAGISFREIQRGTGFSVSTLAGALITHQHGDHSKAVADLMRAGVDVYLSRGTADALDLSGHCLHFIRALEQFTVGSWTILPFESIHDAAEPLNFLLASGDEKLVYLTDTAYCPYRFKGLTHVMIECNYALDILNRNVESGAVPAAMKRRIMKSHMSIDTAKGFLQANNLTRVREVWLIHLSDGNSDAERFKREVQAVTGKPVIVAEKRVTGTIA